MTEDGAVSQRPAIVILHDDHEVCDEQRRDAVRKWRDQAELVIYAYDKFGGDRAGVGLQLAVNGLRQLFAEADR
jgi:hypothetical protein